MKSHNFSQDLGIWSDLIGYKGWSHDIGMRFHEIWCLTRCWMWFGLNKMCNILLTRLLQRGDLLNKSFYLLNKSFYLLNKSSRSYILLRSSREIWHQTRCARDFTYEQTLFWACAVRVSSAICLETLTFCWIESPALQGILVMTSSFYF